jgi:hypothetical protein
MNERSKVKRDMNRDPITKAPGSHPVGTGLGAAGGAVAGAAIGGLFGPLGMLVGGGVGALAGGGAGHAVGERVNPTGEIEYWSSESQNRDYYDSELDFDRDYLPAYRHGWESRSTLHDRDWDDGVEEELQTDWDTVRGDSSLEWDEARPAVRDAWDRTDQTYRAYSGVDSYFQDRYSDTDYYDTAYEYDDYRPAYRFGTYARSQYPEREWDDRLESELKREWKEFKGDSRLTWDKAKYAARDAWDSVERALPGDFDNDGR